MSVKGEALLNPVQQFLDASGNPYAGGTVTFTVVGLSTLQNVYTDVALSTPAVNPVPLNAGGWYSSSSTGPITAIYLQQLPYDVTLKDSSGTVIWGPVTVSGSSIAPGANYTFSGEVTFSGGTQGGWTTITVTDVGTQNDYAPNGLFGNTIIRCNNASTLTITGFSGGVDGQQIRLVSINAEVRLSYQTGSLAANQITTYVTSGTTRLATTTGTATLQYDGTSQKWRLIEHEQGDWISISGASLYSPSGWSAFTTQIGLFYLKGRVLFVELNVAGTSNAVTAVFNLPYTCVSGVNAYAFGVAVDNGGTAAATIIRNQSSSANLESFATVAQAAFTNSGTKSVSGTWSGQVT